MLPFFPVPHMKPEWSTRHTSTRDTGISHVEWGSNHDIDLAVKICWQSITISISPDVNEKLMDTSITLIIQNQGNIKIFTSNYPTQPPPLSLSASFLVPYVGLPWFSSEKTIYFYLTGQLFHINISFKLALGPTEDKLENWVTNCDGWRKFLDFNCYSDSPDKTF